MSSYIKVILGSLILASMLVVINSALSHFLVSKPFNIFNVRSLILFIFVFLASITAIEESAEED